MSIFSRQLNSYEQIILAVFMICIGILIYIRAVQSRKYYKCKECGESFRVEQMEASHCKTCGAKVVLSDDPNVTDKAKQ